MPEDEDSEDRYTPQFPEQTLLHRVVGYRHSTRRADGAELWSARVDLSARGALLFAGYARGRDTLDLRSIGRGRSLGDPTHAYTLGATLRVGRHGLTIAATRYEGADTRHTLGFVWRWTWAEHPEPVR